MAKQHLPEMVALFAKYGYELKPGTKLREARYRCADLNSWTNEQRFEFRHKCSAIGSIDPVILTPLRVYQRDMLLKEGGVIQQNFNPKATIIKIAKEHGWTEKQRKTFLYKVIGFTAPEDNNIERDISMLKDLVKKYGINDSKTPHSKRQYLKLFAQYYIYIPHHLKETYVLMTKNVFIQKVRKTPFSLEDIPKKGIVLQALMHHVSS